MRAAGLAYAQAGLEQRYAAMRSTLVLGAVVGTVSLVGCGAEPAGLETSGRVEVSVAALSLSGIVDACYDLTVTSAAGTVWSQQSVCARQYGAGADITYVGPCDATDTNGDEPGGTDNTISLTVSGLYSGAAGTTPVTDFIDPCAAPHAPNGCQLTVPCRENADTPVVFNLTLMRQANQGFFDVAVNFADIFCSAKVDCGGTQSLMLVHDPESGERVASAVLALTCTDGSDVGSVPRTHLYRDAVRIVCGSQSFTVDPSEGPGNVYPDGAGAPDPVVQAMVFEGVQAITDSVTGVATNALYWNVALGLDTAWFAAQPAGTTCRLQTLMTASEGALDDGETPDDATYPYIAVDVPLWTTGPQGQRQCGRHPLNGVPAGVATAYTPSDAPQTFAYSASATAGQLTSGPVITACSPSPCDPEATCTESAEGTPICECPPGLEGDGFECTTPAFYALYELGYETGLPEYVAYDPSQYQVAFTPLSSISYVGPDAGVYGVNIRDEGVDHCYAVQFPDFVNAQGVPLNFDNGNSIVTLAYGFVGRDVCHSIIYDLAVAAGVADSTQILRLVRAGVPTSVTFGQLRMMLGM